MSISETQKMETNKALKMKLKQVSAQKLSFFCFILADATNPNPNPNPVTNPYPYAQIILGIRVVS